MSDLNAAIKLDVADAEAYRLRGIIHKVMHEYDKSLADYEKAIALDPKNAARLPHGGVSLIRLPRAEVSRWSKGRALRDEGVRTYRME